MGCNCFRPRPSATNQVVLTRRRNHQRTCSMLSGHALVQPSHQSWWRSNSPKMAEATGSSEFTPGKLVLTASISFSFFVLIDIIDLFPSISQPNPTQATNPVLQSRRLKNKTNNEFNNPSIQGKQKERRGSSCREERLYKYMQLSSDTRHAS
jgi:hypothetical protein